MMSTLHQTTIAAVDQACVAYPPPRKPIQKTAPAAIAVGTAARTAAPRVGKFEACGCVAVREARRV
jgi:hypothetical protein